MREVESNGNITSNIAMLWDILLMNKESQLTVNEISIFLYVYIYIHTHIYISIYVCMYEGACIGILSIDPPWKL